jgi:hypothetical protein
VPQDLVTPPSSKGHLRTVQAHIDAVRWLRSVHMLQTVKPLPLSGSSTLDLSCVTSQPLPR